MGVAISGLLVFLIECWTALVPTSGFHALPEWARLLMPVMFIGAAFREPQGRRFAWVVIAMRHRAMTLTALRVRRLKTVSCPYLKNSTRQWLSVGIRHMQFDRTVGAVRVVNAGSVGMPFGEPSADWLLLGPSVQLRHTAYDLIDAARRIRQTTYPQAEDFAAHNILQPPSEQTMREVFTKGELR